MSDFVHFLMAEYRAYIVGEDGHFVGSEGFISCDDGEAIETAMRLVDGRDIELWSGPRFVVKLAKVGNRADGGTSSATNRHSLKGDEL
jgi:hypothetical protein